MRQVEKVAELSVARACGFAVLAIAGVLMAFADRPLLMLGVAAVLFSGLAVLLELRARGARGRPYRRTETWLMLRPDQRPPGEIAQRAVGMALEEAYRRFATLATRMALWLWAAFFAIRLVLWLAG